MTAMWSRSRTPSPSLNMLEGTMINVDELDFPWTADEELAKY